jgi:hypothetical protein
MEVDEKLEFITCPVDGRSKSIEKNVGTDAWINPRIDLGVDGVVGLLITSIKLCQCLTTSCMACPFVDFK